MRGSGDVVRAAAGVAVGLAVWAVAPRVELRPAPGGEPGLAAATAPDAGAEPDYGRFPLHFEPNVGQADGAVDFVARGPGYAVLLEATRATIAVSRTARPRPAEDAGPAPGETRTALLRMHLEGGREAATPEALETLPGRSHYLLGGDPERWRTDVPNYARVRYDEVYPGIDVVYYGDQRRLEYDLVVAPGTDPGQVRLAFDGGEVLRVDDEGHLALSVAGSALRLRAPLVYQEAGGVREEIPTRYALGEDGRVRFDVGAYDADQPLVIDPVFEYSTFLGGSSIDEVRGVAVTAAGEAVVTGATLSLNFPVTGTPFPASPATGDVYVAKLSASGDALLFSSYIGGSSFDGGLAVDVDDAGFVYLTGQSRSPDLPLVNAARGYAGGLCGTTQNSVLFPCFDAFVMKLTPAGDGLVYSTYWGGGAGFCPVISGRAQCLGHDTGDAIAVDPSGHAVIAGFTDSISFPTVNPIRAANTGGGSWAEGFVARFDPSGGVVYSTYLGGFGTDAVLGADVDGGGHAYLAGFTSSADFPIRDALIGSRPGASSAFVTRLSETGALVHSTYFGGTNFDDGRDIALGPDGSLYLVGQASSADLPVANAAQPSLAGAPDAYLARLTNTADALIFSTYLGGNGVELPVAVAVDATGHAVVTGANVRGGFPLLDPLQSAPQGFWAGFVTRFAPGGEIVYSTYLDGAEPRPREQPWDVAVDSAGAAYVGGVTSAANFPSVNALQPVLGGSFDGFLTKIGPGVDLALRKTAAPEPVMVGEPLTYTIRVTNHGPGVARAVEVVDALPATVTLGSATPEQGSCGGTGPVTCELGDLSAGAEVVVEIVVTPGQAGPLVNTASVSALQGDADPSNDEDSATSLVEANQPPVAVDDTASTAEDTPVEVHVLDDDTDPDGDPIALAGASGAANGTLTLGADTITYAPDPDFNGADAFTYTIRDDRGLEATASVAVTVSAVNDAPSFAPGPDVSVPEDSGPQALPWAGDVSAGPADESGQALAFEVTTSQAGLFASGPALSPAGVLSFTSAPDAHGSASVTVVLRDDGGTAAGGLDRSLPRTFTLAVTPVNDPPRLAAPAAQSSDENTSPTLLLSAADVDGDALSFGASGLPPGLSVDAATGLIGGSLDFDSAGTYAVTVTASDGELSDAASFEWVVNDVNRAPAVTNPGAQTSDENSSPSLPIAASDPDGDALGFTATGLPPGLSIDAASGLIGGSLDFDSAGTYPVTVSASDGDLSGSASFEWVVRDVNRAPDAVDDDATAALGTPTPIPVLANDSDPDGDPLTVSGVTPGLYGTVTTDGTGVTYTGDVFQALSAAIAQTGLGGGQQNSLNSKLAAARRALARGNAEAAAHEMGAFRNAVRAFERSGRLSPAEAAALIGPVDALLNGALTDTFTYTIDDGKGGTDTGQVTVRIG